MIEYRSNHSFTKLVMNIDNAPYSHFQALWLRFDWFSTGTRDALLSLDEFSVQGRENDDWRSTIVDVWLLGNRKEARK